MPLQVTLTDSRRLVSAPVLRQLGSALASSGHAVLLVPSFAQALEAQRALAQEPGLSLGVTTTTPDAWIDERRKEREP